VVARFSAPIQTGPETHPASCTMGTGSFPWGKERPGRDADPSPLLVPWSRQSRNIPLLPLWALRPVKRLSACTRVTFTFKFFLPHSLTSMSEIWRWGTRRQSKPTRHTPRQAFNSPTAETNASRNTQTFVTEITALCQSTYLKCAGNRELQSKIIKRK
jgi:hypothetical protein